MTIQTPDSSTVVVLLTDSTQVAQVQGMFKARRKEMSMAALIPGLQVQVEGSYNQQNQLVASSVKFKGNDLAGRPDHPGRFTASEGADSSRVNRN